MTKKIALGKGIASLIQETPNQLLAQNLREEGESTPKAVLDSGKEIFEEHAPSVMAISEIKTNPNQPRKIFKKAELEDLAQSIRENGIIQPLIISKTDEGFELVAGERRLRAAQKVGLTQVPVILKQNVTNCDKMIMSIIENIQRSDLNCVEEALAYYRLMEDFQLTQEEVARRLGKERSSVANFLRILGLPREVLELVQTDRLSFGHAKILAGLKERGKVISLANQAVKKELSVRELEKISRKAAKKAISATDQELEKKYENLREKLEQHTGFHFSLSAKRGGAGSVNIKFSNQGEFNRIYDFLLNSSLDHE